MTMGEGLRRVAAQCGGMKVKALDGEELHYDAKSRLRKRVLANGEVIHYDTKGNIKPKK